MAGVVRLLQRIGHDSRHLVVAGSWAALNWLLDAAALWVFLLAVGYRVDVVGLLVAFGVANVLAVLPITSGVIRVVEGVTVPILVVAFGCPPPRRCSRSPAGGWSASGSPSPRRD